MKTGISQRTPGNGDENYNFFKSRIGSKKLQTLVQYDYRTENGELFSCVRKSIEEARAARDAWVKKTQDKEL